MRKNPEAYLTGANESILVSCVELQDNVWISSLKMIYEAWFIWFYLVSVYFICMNYQNMLQKLYIQIPKFMKNKPGPKWIIFLQRHPEIRSRSRMDVCEADVKEWFHITWNYLMKKNSFSVLKEADNVIKRAINFDLTLNTPSKHYFLCCRY